MKRSDSTIAKGYRYVTGIALLAVYLLGSASSIYSVFHQNHNSHSHHSKTHCETTLCTCSHEDGECICNERSASSDDHVAFEQCPTPVADHYTGHSFSSFLTESFTSLLVSIIEKPLPVPPTAQAVQHITDPPLDPPRLA